MGSEETYLQLYWLVNLIPNLDPARLPLDWLIRGLGACGPGAGRLRELLRRELTADASLALRERVFVFFRRSAPPALAHDVAIPRWKAARDVGRWGLILADIQSLRNWLPETDNDTWARLLLAASANLVWAERPDSEHAAAFCLEVEQLAHRNDDYAAELYQIEFAQIVKAGLDRLGGRNGGTSGLFALLACSWDDPGPELRSRLRFYIDQIAREPALALEGMDRIFGVAPAVLGRISALFGGLDSDDSRFPPRKDLDDLAPTIERFLAEHRWTEYRSLRLPLLRFCIQEAISPGLVSRILAERPSFVLTGKSPLAQSIADDWPLRHVYRATELRWNEPAEFTYGS